MIVFFKKTLLLVVLTPWMGNYSALLILSRL